MANFNYSANIKLNMDANSAKQQLASLQQELNKISNIPLRINSDFSSHDMKNIRQAAIDAMELSTHLNSAINVDTGKLDFSKFMTSISYSNKSLKTYAQSLLNLGHAGQDSFIGLARSVAQSEVPLKRTSKLVDQAWTSIKKTAGWQMSSSLIHGLIGQMQQAVGYAKDLDRSLNDIRIVTGASSEQMAKFAKEANVAAKSLSTTTTNYTKASLIYYQQGLSEKEVQERTATTIKMANVTGSNADKVSSQMTAVWNNFDDGSKSLEYYADVMAKLGAVTASSTDEIAEGLQKFAAISDTVGLSYEYATSALATVTSASRESADVVGNSFKTLFARIQGLQLGETLEDGTDLNKYSQALDKVGISIKDASGNMKDMDTILDEMGNTWQTLRKDEQMALAQTVAGVRQYTQLVTLMNNWDQFKQNVNTAENAKGTLNQQTAIYEKSWQAASKRVRASTEGIWDSLINSDGFVTALDGFSSLLDMVESLVDSLGGATGVLSLFGGILAKTFTPHISQALREGLDSTSRFLAHPFSKEARRDALIQEKYQQLESIMSATEKGAMPESIKGILQEEAKDSIDKDRRRKFMNAQQIEMDDRLEAQKQALNDRRIRAERILHATEKTDIQEARTNTGGKAATALGKIDKTIFEGSYSMEQILGDRVEFLGKIKKILVEDFDEDFGKDIDNNSTFQQIKSRLKSGNLTQDQLGKLFEKLLVDQLQMEDMSDYEAVRNTEISQSSAEQIKALRDRQEALAAETRKQEKTQGAVEAAEAMTFMIALGQSAHSLGESFSDLMAGAGDAGEALASVATGALTFVQNAGTLSDSLSHLGGEDSFLNKKMGGISAAGWIGFGLSAVTTIASAVKGYFDAEQQKANERYQKTIDDAKETQKKLDENRNAITNLNSSMVNYQKTADAYENDEVSIDTKNQARRELLQQVQSYGGDVSGAAVAKILGGDVAGAQEEMYNARMGELSAHYTANKAAINDSYLKFKDNSDLYAWYKHDDQYQPVAYQSSNGGLQDIMGPSLEGYIHAGWVDNIFADTDSAKALKQFESILGDSDLFTFDNSQYARIKLNIKNARDLVDVYDQLQAAINSGTIDDSDMLDEAKNFTSENQAAVEEAREAIQSQAKNAAEYGILEKQMYKMTNIRDYDKARNELIDEMWNNSSQNDNKAANSYKAERENYLEKKEITEMVDNQLIHFMNSIGNDQSDMAIAYNALLKISEKSSIAAIPGGATSSGATSSGAILGATGINQLTMDNLMDMYEAVGNDMFNINFDSLSQRDLQSLNDAINFVQTVQGKPITFKALLESGQLTSQTIEEIKSAQMYADANAIKVAVEVVKNFNTKEDRFNKKDSKEFIDSYNKIMGYDDDDDRRLTAEKMGLMTESELLDSQFISSQQGRKIDIDSAQYKYDAEKKSNTEAQNKVNAKGAAYDSAIDTYLSTSTITDQNGDGKADAADAEIVKSNLRAYGTDIDRYKQLKNSTALTTEQVEELAGLTERLSGAGIIGEDNQLLKDYQGDLTGVTNAYNDYQRAVDEKTGSDAKLLEIQDDIDNGELKKQDLILKEAEFYGIAADSIIQYAEELERKDIVTQKTGESDEEYHTRLMRIALDYQKNTIGLEKLQAAYKKYKTAQDKANSKESRAAWGEIKQAIGMITNMPLGDITDDMVKTAIEAGVLEDALAGDAEAIRAIENIGRQHTIKEDFEDIADAVKSMGQDAQDAFNSIADGAEGFAERINAAMETVKLGDYFGLDLQKDIGTYFDLLTQEAYESTGNFAEAQAQAIAKLNGMGIGVESYQKYIQPGTVITANADIPGYALIPTADGGLEPIQTDGLTISGNHVTGGGWVTGWRYTNESAGGSNGDNSGGGGGGGGGPKKVATQRKSATVKRYKRVDHSRSSAQSSKKRASTRKDYLYGESKIAQMEKINKLAEKEARITSDRIKESRKYLEEDRENLTKVMQKYGYEAEFDTDGFFASYEETWTKIHDKIAKLYEDNELTKDEQKLEEDYKLELEELEGALEDYENSLSELQADIEAYEESLYEMYDNKVEQMQHKVEFKIQLNEDDISYLDFWIEALGDSLYNALEVLQTLGQKTNILFDGLDTYKQGIEDIYALSDDPLHTWATGGMDELLTQDQVDALRENRDGLMEYMQQLIDLRSTMQDKVLEVFDKWQEKLNSTMSTIEHYSSVLEHFKNIIDIVGKDSLGLNNQFMVNLEQNAINQSMDTIDATKAHYDAIVASNAEAQKNLEAAIASGDQARIEHWEGVVQSTSEAMQEAQDSLLSSLENTLTMIADQFESAMTRAVEAFNDAIYAHGGLQGLQDDYSSIREQSQLMAEDYQKIYELSKLNRNINKTLNDSNIIAGKQKMKSLQQEINELQASGVQLSQYDLEYLQAKYELRLAEIELENAQNNKDTVRLSKDSEGNWSYIYTSSVDKVDEAQQKYEDALYNMQNLSYEYMEEMSTTMMQTSLAMMEEIQALRIQDFDSYEAYSAEVQRIQDKYSAYLNNQQNELNKSVANNEELYNRDWQSYNATTGYKISANQDWADSYSETTLGALMDSESKTSDFANVIFNLSNMFTDELGMSAQNYFANAEMAMNKYGTSIKNFGTTATNTMTNISSKSKTAADDMKTMAQDMTNSFKDIADAVVDWQEEFSGQINSMLEEIGKLVESINDAIQKSAEMTSGKTNSGELIGTSDAIKLLNEKKELGKFEAGENGQIVVNGETYANWVEYNGKFIEAIDAKLAEYSQAPLGSEQRKQLAEELKGLFRRYHLFKEVVDRIYDPTSKSTLDLENPNYSSFDTGGYTGEWGKSGKFAMLHEKELILNSDDTENFLSALNVSRDIIHSIIEMNARQSSLALGNLVPSSIQDMSQNLEQQVSITAEFPNATNHSEIEEAFNNLINTASQYANRYPF